MCYGMDCPHAERVVCFLSKIGLNVEVVHGAEGFLNGVKIVKGGLHIDPGASVSSLLHEAGHLAIVPQQYRCYLDGNIMEGLSRALTEMEENGQVGDDPLVCKMLQTGDTEATAWAWAAGIALNLPGELVIQDQDYGNEGAGVRLGLSMSSYVGINGMAHAGFCCPRVSLKGLPVYPKLAFWLQR